MPRLILLKSGGRVSWQMKFRRRDSAQFANGVSPTARGWREDFQIGDAHYFYFTFDTDNRRTRRGLSSRNCERSRHRGRRHDYEGNDTEEESSLRSNDVIYCARSQISA